MNVINKRSLLCNESLNDLLLSIEGPSLKDFRTGRKEKLRRPHQNPKKYRKHSKSSTTQSAEVALARLKMRVKMRITLNYLQSGMPGCLQLHSLTLIS